MRAFRAAAVATVTAVLSAVVLAGCGPSGSGAGSGGDGDAPPATPTSAGSAPATPPAATPPPATPPATTTPPAASQPPAAGETLVRVSRSGGFAGETHTLIVKGDGSWTRLDGKAKQEGSGRLEQADLDALRAALTEADFARLPRIATSSPKIFDGFFYAFVHGGYEVAADQGALSPALDKVLGLLPSFTNG
ncbi:hypothetical protein ACFWBN_06600 [Streptomyces sp. NPDC059989]|uniref:hypothetical protein n=1 Tax=Streptomyces sp. NPDC059989 TaxID=3347026 RepID=UPI0036788552